MKDRKDREGENEKSKKKMTLRDKREGRITNRY